MHRHLQAFQAAEAAGVDPQKLMAELSKDPEVMELMSKPNVLQGIMKMQNEPEKAIECMADPDVAKVVSKMTAIQQKQGFNAVAPQGGAGGAPPAPGTPPAEGGTPPAFGGAAGGGAQATQDASGKS